MTRIPLAIPTLLAGAALAQPTTTVITHGFSLGDKGVWVQGMAEEILLRAGAGRIYRYEYAAQQHRLSSVPNPPGIPDDPETIVLIFNWTDDSGLGVVGENWGFTQGAADALTGVLRDTEYVSDPGPPDLVSDRILHLVGHSRGAVVIAETARRLAVAGIAVDQTTALDPHPVNGTLDDCNPFDNLDWGDSTPAKWSTTTFADNYWRQDGNFCDFDGMSLPGFSEAELDESALVQGGYGFEHSDVHLWYHATIDVIGEACDGEACMSADLRDIWFTPPEPNPLYDDEFGGFYYTFLGGGADERPDQSPGEDPGTLPIVVNGGFDRGAVSGWRYHGGNASPSDIDEIGNDAYLRLSPSNIETTHNRLFVPTGASDVTFRFRTFTPGLDDVLVFDLIDDDGTMLTSQALALDSQGEAFADNVLAIAPEPGAKRLRARIDPGPDLIVQATVGVDDIDITVSVCPADCNQDGVLNVLDFVCFQNDWATQTPAGDCNGDGAYDILDFVCFQNLFAQGC